MPLTITQGKSKPFESSSNSVIEDDGKLAILMKHSLVKMFRKPLRLHDLSWTGGQVSQMLL